MEPGSEASAILARCRLPEYPGGLGFGFHLMFVLRNLEMFSFFLILTIKRVLLKSKLKAAEKYNKFYFLLLFLNIALQN